MPLCGGRDTMQVQLQLVVKECLFLFSFLGRSHQVNIILLSEYSDVGDLFSVSFQKLVTMKNIGQMPFLSVFESSVNETWWI